MMSHSAAQKKSRVFALLPARQVTPDSPRRYRERPARVRTSAEISLDEDMPALFDKVRDDDGQHPTPEFVRVVRGQCWPWRILARFIVRAAKKGGDEESVLAIIDRLRVFVRDVFRKYGSQRRAA